MHCELAIPALRPGEDWPVAEAGTPRTPALELLLARGRVTLEDPASLEEWLARAFDAEQNELAAGALTVLADGGEAEGAQWLRADPVHLKLNRDHLLLIPAAGFEIDRAEADALCAALNAHFSGELAFLALRPDRWCVRADRIAADLRTTPPLAAAGRDANAHLPRGADAKRWHALANEAQMLLHDHPVNAAREERGVPALNSVWLWGAGRLPDRSTGPWHSVLADEPLALGLAHIAGMRHQALPQDADQWLARAPQDGRHLIVLDQLRAARALDDPAAHGARLAALETTWFAPLLQALRSARVGMLTVHALDRSFVTARGDLRRFWRRPRPLADYT